MQQACTKRPVVFRHSDSTVEMVTLPMMASVLNEFKSIRCSILTFSLFCYPVIDMLPAVLCFLCKGQFFQLGKVELLAGCLKVLPKQKVQFGPMWFPQK